MFLADHKDRLSCGKCGYTEFKGSKPVKTPEGKQEKPKEEIKVEPEIPAEEKIKEEPAKEIEENKPETENNN